MYPEIVEYGVSSKIVTTFQLPEFRQDLVDLAQKGHRGVLINLTGVESLDSSALGAIILLARLLPSPGRVCLFGVRREIRILCEVLRLNAVIGLAETREEATSDIETYLARKIKVAWAAGRIS